jgi:hypothetical protein
MANYLYFKQREQRPLLSVNGHNVMQSETGCHRPNATNPSPYFAEYANHQGTYINTPAFIHNLILRTCDESDRTARLANNARYAMQINSRSNTRTPHTPTSTFRT